jgi:uncharacterized protein
VAPAALSQVDPAEQALKAMGYRVLRVRHFSELGRVEIAAGELDRGLEAPELVTAAVRSAGR